MPRGANPKREREYKELERKFEQEGRYPGREAEVAARIVNRQRAEAGEAGKASVDPGGKEVDKQGDKSGGAAAAGERADQDERPGRRGTGHRRRNTARRNKAS